MRPQGSAEDLERRRTHAVQLVRRGVSPATIASVLGVAVPSVYRWRQMARRRGGLRAKPTSGRPRRMSNLQLRQLRALLQSGAVAYGWPSQLWTALRVTILIERYFGIRYHPEHVRRLLKERLHWTSQKPQKRARQRDDQEVERWIAEEWPRILCQAAQRRAHLALLDESGFLMAPVVRRTLAPRGQTPILPCSASHDRISVISAITLSPHALRVGLHFMLLGDNENFHGEEVVLFLRQLKSEVGGPWTIVWDRNRIHSKSQVVRAWLAKHPEVVYEDFPAYAPDVNPDESVWCWTKYGRLSNVAPADVDELREHIWDALTTLEDRPQLLKSFILHAKLPLVADYSL